MQLIGLGTDIIEVARIKDSLSKLKEAFTHKLFTEKERLYCEQFARKEERYAGRFAAKESIVKALGTGFGPITWTQIEVLPNKNGKPIVTLAPPFDTIQVEISISHTKELAVATALAYLNSPEN